MNCRPLKSGGNGDLFIGIRGDTGEQVVLKRLREFRDAHARRTFAREVRILAYGLQGVMHVLHYDLETEQPYYVMPYVPGGPVTQHAGRLSDGQLHGVATAIANTLAILHGRQVAHGDVKPDNILVTQDGNLQIADPLGNGTGCTVMVSANHGGTPGYWAPEIRHGGPISTAGDAYSFGATLYHLATGRKPEDGVPLDLSPQRYRNVSRIYEIITVCCQADPDSRPPMDEGLQMLRGTSWATITAQRAQKRAVATLAVVLGGLLVIGLVADM